MTEFNDIVVASLPARRQQQQQQIDAVTTKLINVHLDDNRVA